MDEKIFFIGTPRTFSHRSDRELKRMQWVYAFLGSPWFMHGVLPFLRPSWGLWPLVRGWVRRSLFTHFCGGETIEDCEPVITRLKKLGIDTILDFSVEGEREEKAYDAQAHEIGKTIEKSPSFARTPFAVVKLSSIGLVPLMEKKQARETLTAQETKALEAIEARLYALCEQAQTHKVRLLIDAEDCSFQGYVDALVRQAMRRYNTQEVIVYHTFQLYRTDRLSALREAHHHAHAEGFRLGAKLVRGAYMEKERLRAREKAYADPIQPSKAACDAAYHAALLFCVQHHEEIALFAGTHNEYSNHYLTQLMAEYKIPRDHPHVHFSQLYGMSDNISYALAEQGYQVAKYMPYGPMDKLLPYLHRRIQENSSVSAQSHKERRLLEEELARRSKKSAQK